MVSKKKKLPEAAENLSEALKQYAAKESELNFLTVAKAFEIAIEYVWRELKRLVEDQGLEAPSPRMAIKQAAKLGLITDPETWLACLEARNNSVHDYFGISQSEYVDLARQLVDLIQRSSFFTSSFQR